MHRPAHQQLQIGRLNHERQRPCIIDIAAETTYVYPNQGGARTYEQCAEILFDLGLCQVKVISNNPDKLHALEQAGLTIVERIPIEVETDSLPGLKQIQGAYLMDVPDGAPAFDPKGLPLYDHLSDTRNHFDIIHRA